MDRSIYQRIREIESVHWWFVGRRKIIESLIRGLPLPRHARIVEVGCGTGGNLALLRRFGEVEALEPDPDARNYAAGQSGVAVEPGALPHDLPFAPASFDLVCAFDVVEHVDDDRGAVKALAGLLVRDGVMLTTVPAYGWMWSRHDELHHHKRRYMRSEYRKLFEDAGLEVVRASYFNTLLFPLAVAQRWAKRLLKIDSPDDALPAPPLNRLLATAFGAEKSFLALSDLPFGLSIFVIARKKA